MSDPKLERTSVQINYCADDGYKAEAGYKSGKGVPALEGGPTLPEAALLAGVEELARLTALFGFEAEARKAFDSAVARVNEWRAHRAD